MPEKSGKITSVLGGSSAQKDVSISMREISNGWLLSKSWVDGRGRFHSEETFSETEPTIGIEASAKAPKPKRRRI